MDGALSLVSGSNDMEGRIEICYEEQYGTICDRGFNAQIASIVCGQLGFSQISNNSRCIVGSTIRICPLLCNGIQWNL